jgi:hypothetical protein
MKRDKIFGIVVVMMFLITIGSFLSSFDITGYAVFFTESNSSLEVNYNVSNNSSYLLDIGGTIMDFKISGLYSLDSDIMVYLNVDSERYIVFDSSLDQGLREYLVQNNSLVSVDFNSSDDIKIVMDYGSHLSPQREDSFIEFSVNRSSFSLDESKVCTKWWVDDSSYVCNGGVECCLFLDREPYLDSWSSPFGVVSSGNLDRRVYASIHYIDYNLSVPYVNISSSLNASLPATFFDYYIFNSEGISDLEENGDYSLEFVVNSGSILVDEIDYSVLGSLGASSANGLSSNLSLSWDDSLGYGTPYVFHNLTLIANYSYLGSAITDATCNITYSDGEFSLMSYAANFYYAYKVFNTSGNYSYNVSCYAGGSDYLNDTRNITIELPVAGFSDSGDVSANPGTSTSLAWGDYDNDDDWDLIFTGSNGAFAYQNNDGTLTSDPSFSFDSVQDGSLGFGDLDNDGDLDLVVNGANSGRTSKVYHNTNSILANVQNLTELDYSSLNLFDYDLDGKIDISQFGKNGDVFSWAFKIYNNSFIEQNSITGQTYGSINSLKLNDKNYILSTGTQNDAASGALSKLYLINNFTLSEQQTLSKRYYSTAATADFDNDGDLDIVIGGSYTADSVYLTDVYKWNGTEFINDQNLTGLRDGSFSIGDINNDGLIDLIIAGFNTSDNFVKFYINNGSRFVDRGNYSIMPINNGATLEGQLSLFDYDNDGDLDLATSGNSLATVYDNNVSLITSNSQPSAPTSFTDSYSDGKFILSWNNGSDDLTPQLGLYYNLRVGTTIGGNNIISGKYGGSSNPTQGYLGNMMQSKEYNLSVTEQTYYWQVQTIDSGLISSGWSTVQTYEPNDCLVPSGDWLVNTTCTKTNEVIYVNGSINITGSLKLINTTLIINEDSNSIYVQGGTLNISNSIINASSTNYYNLDVNGSSTFDMGGSIIQKASTFNLRNDNIELNNNIISNENYGVKLYGSNITIIDSTVSGGTHDVVNTGLNNNLTNVTFSTKSVTSGSLYVNYYLDTTITDETNTAVSSVNVTAYDNNTNVIGTTLTDSMGYARLTLISYVANTSDYSYNNYTISYIKNLLVPINRSRNLTSNTVLSITMDTSDLPITTGFDSELTTDFESVTDLGNVSNVKVGRNNLGMVQWLVNLNVTQLNFSNLVSINDNYVSVTGTKLNYSANISLFNLSYVYEPVIWKGNSICSSCTVLSYSNSNLTFNVSSFSYYNTTANSYVNLSYSDLGNERYLANENIWFYANYTNRSSNLVINNGNCTINFNDYSANMSYSSGLYVYNRSFSSTGTYNYNVSCNRIGFETMNVSSSFEIKVNATLFSVDDMQNLEGTYKWSASLIINDLNGDNYLDVVLSGQRTDNENDANLLLYLKNQTTFNLEYNGFIYNITAGTISLNDYDMDGDQDIFIEGLDSSIEQKFLIIEND